MGHIHSNSEYDYTVSAVIVHDSKVLLLFHHKLDIWVSPSGHIELNETPIEALYRETLEESGIAREHLTLIPTYQDHFSFERDATDSTIPTPFDIGIHPVGNEGHRHIDFGYILESDTTDVVAEKGGAQDLRWFSVEEIEQLADIPKNIVSRAKYAINLVNERSAS